MSKNITVGLLYVLIGVIIIFVIYYFYQTSTSKNNYPLVADFKSSMNKIETINIHSTVTGVNITSSNDEYFYAQLEQSNKNQNKLLTIDTSQSNSNELILSVKGQQSRFSFINIGFKMSKLNIQVPQQYKGTLIIESSTGSIIIESINVNTLQAKATTGAININDIDNHSLNVKATTGAIRLDNISSQDIALDSTTGAIHVNKVVAESLTAKASTGNIRIDSEIEKVEVKTTTGSIHMKQTNIKDHSKLTSTTGNIHVNLHENPQSLYVNFDTSVGRYDINKIGYNVIQNSKDKFVFQFGTGSINLDVKTSTGSFHFN